MGDYDIRRFIALFIKDNYARLALVRNKMNPSALKIVNEAMRGITYMAKRYGDEEDIRQTVDMTFFQCIGRYQRKDSEKGPIPFSAFLYSYFFYLLKKNVPKCFMQFGNSKIFCCVPNILTSTSISTFCFNIFNSKPQQRAG